MTRLTKALQVVLYVRATLRLGRDVVDLGTPLGAAHDADRIPSENALASIAPLMVIATLSSTATMRVNESLRISPVLRARL